MANTEEVKKTLSEFIAEHHINCRFVDWSQLTVEQFHKYKETENIFKDESTGVTIVAVYYPDKILSDFL